MLTQKDTMYTVLINHHRYCEYDPSPQTGPTEVFLYVHVHSESL